MKRVASPGSMHDTGCLGPVHWDDPEGWYGEGGGMKHKGTFANLGLSLDGPSGNHEFSEPERSAGSAGLWP